MMSFWWRKDLVRPGGAGQVDAIWMAESDSDDRDGRTVERIKAWGGGLSRVLNRREVPLGIVNE